MMSVHNLCHSFVSERMGRANKGEDSTPSMSCKSSFGYQGLLPLSKEANFAMCGGTARALQQLLWGELNSPYSSSSHPKGCMEDAC